MTSSNFRSSVFDHFKEKVLMKLEDDDFQFISFKTARNENIHIEDPLTLELERHIREFEIAKEAFIINSILHRDSDTINAIVQDLSDHFKRQCTLDLLTDEFVLARIDSEQLARASKSIHEMVKLLHYRLCNLYF